MNEKQYSARLNGASFLHRELKIIAPLKLNGMSDKEIREKVLNENLFQVKKVLSSERLLPSVIDRANALDDYLLNKILEADLSTSKMINLLAIVKTERLFYEFMNEVIAEKFRTNDFQLETKDFNMFFNHKIEQTEFVANLSDESIKRLKSIFKGLLYHAGYIDKRNGTELSPVYLEKEIIKHIKANGDTHYMMAMGLNNE